MIEETVQRRLNRRTRGERTKRRERYLLSNGKNSSDILVSSTDSHSIENNNCVKGQVPIMGNKITVDILSYLLGFKNRTSVVIFHYAQEFDLVQPSLVFQVFSILFYNL